LVEVLEQLHFINETEIRRKSAKTGALLSRTKQRLSFDTEEGLFRGESEDVTKNLFKFCCAVLNLRPK
jgi:hypothetical protein